MRLEFKLVVLDRSRAFILWRVFPMPEYVYFFESFCLLSWLGMASLTYRFGARAETALP